MVRLPDPAELMAFDAGLTDGDVARRALAPLMGHVDELRAADPAERWRFGEAMFLYLMQLRDAGFPTLAELDGETGNG